MKVIAGLTGFVGVAKIILRLKNSLIEGKNLRIINDSIHWNFKRI